MPESRTRYLSSTRTLRGAGGDDWRPPGVASPVGPDHMTAGARSDMSAQDQAEALRRAQVAPQQQGTQQQGMQQVPNAQLFAPRDPRGQIARQDSAVWQPTSAARPDSKLFDPVGGRADSNMWSPEVGKYNVDEQGQNKMGAGAPAPRAAAPAAAPVDPYAAPYARGGYDAVKQTPDWYELPEHLRTQVLSGQTAGTGTPGFRR